MATERFATLDQTIARYDAHPDALIQVLHAAQQLFGHLSADVLRYVAGVVEAAPVASVRRGHVLPFLHHHTARQAPDHGLPRTPCVTCAARSRSWRSSKKNWASSEGETTKDNLFSLSTARCIGACALAPAVSIGDDVYGKLTADKVPHFVQARPEEVHLNAMFEELSLHILDIAMNSLAAGAKPGGDRRAGESAARLAHRARSRQRPRHGRRPR